jgi:hypothetical protein
MEQSDPLLFVSRKDNLSRLSTRILRSVALPQSYQGFDLATDNSIDQIQDWVQITNLHGYIDPPN